jgi:hypothetical protein
MYSLKIQLVYGCGHVPRLSRARVHVPEVEGQKVDVMEDKATPPPRLQFLALHKPNVHKLGPIEIAVTWKYSNLNH